ncbi:receptor-transporting protein 3-like [Sinocyclocheilus anshuiensis]|uniref:Receptor-transporting protein 3-like n=1 Tax=Sinocyclocheilus anshuiensis TaxID=1608454 RepID=A0A671RDY2_9TELE|nr:PREDICTED: receptor-transporting protein 3-like [Sinocyclocheilus anshuiensis]
MISLWNSSLQEKISELHDDTWNIEIDETIVENSPARDWHQYISGSFAQFRCSLCRKTWGSKRVRVLFHFHLNTARNRGTIKVRRFKQKCRRCTEAQWEDPNFPVENIDVLVERLVKNIRVKCYRDNLGETNRSSVFIGRVNGPHETAHCEACHKGVCSQAN